MSSPCQNGGTCKVHANGYCHCNASFVGFHCERHVNACHKEKACAAGLACVPLMMADAVNEAAHACVNLTSRQVSFHQNNKLASVSF